MSVFTTSGFSVYLRLYWKAQSNPIEPNRNSKSIGPFRIMEFYLREVHSGFIIPQLPSAIDCWAPNLLVFNEILSRNRQNHREIQRLTKRIGEELIHESSNITGAKRARNLYNDNQILFPTISQNIMYWVRYHSHNFGDFVYNSLLWEVFLKRSW